MNKYTELLKRSSDIIKRLKAADRTTHAIWDHLLQDAITEIQTLRAIVSEIEQATPAAWETTSGDLIRSDGQKYNEHWEPLYRHPTESTLEDGQLEAIVVAYQMGFEKGLIGTTRKNPYAPSWSCDKAWDYGYYEGRIASGRLDDGTL